MTRKGDCDSNSPFPISLLFLTNFIPLLTVPLVPSLSTLPPPGNLPANCRENARSLPGIFRRLAGPILAAKRPPPQSFPCESRQSHGTKPARSRQKAGHLPAN